MTHHVHTRRILDKLAEGDAVSQRSLSRDLGIALGLTNLLLRRLVAKGSIRVVRLRPNHVRYVLTPAGLAQKARLSRDNFLRSVRFYTEARDRVQQRFAEIEQDSHGDEVCSVVFYGAGEIAEVGWLCAQRTRLRLVAVLDDDKAGRDFFGLVVLPGSTLEPDHCNGILYDRIIVTATTDEAALAVRLNAAGIAAEKVVWL